MKFQIYTDDGRWVGEFDVDNDEISSETELNLRWADFLDYVIYLKEQSV